MGISIKPRKGDALMFFDMNVEGEKGDRKSLHASCPTLKVRRVKELAAPRSCWPHRDHRCTKKHELAHVARSS